MANLLKVMTYNMANYDDHAQWPTRSQMFSQVIMEKQPDIILFQEVRFNPDQPNTKVNYQNMAEEVLAILQKKINTVGPITCTYPWREYLWPLMT